MSLENLLDDLLFFNQESTDNTVSDTVSTAGTTVSTADVLVSLGDSGEFTGTEGLDLYILINTNPIYIKTNTYTSEGFTTVTTTGSLDRLLLVLVNKVTT